MVVSGYAALTLLSDVGRATGQAVYQHDHELVIHEIVKVVEAAGADWTPVGGVANNQR
jgi:hypothetical protein